MHILGDGVSEMRIDPLTAVYGLIGFPVSHSLSPAMHNAAFQHLGMNAVYLAFAVHPDSISRAIQSALTLSIRGFNVTIPHKEAILPSIDVLSPEASLFRSVNTVVLREGKTYGYNTDGPGFVASLEEEGIQPSGRTLILGAGGAARAIGFQLALAGMEVRFVDDPPARAEQLGDLIRTHTGCNCGGLAWNDIDAALRHADLVVNATPVGMYPHTNAMPPISLKKVKTSAVIADIIYNPQRTRLLEEASALGLQTVGGLGMFIHQGARSFELFTGEKAPVSLMRETVLSLL